jgi:manganese/zinc/iron transport system permease protein
MIAYNTALVLAGTSLLGASCGLIGAFALLRRRALLGDTLAHAALPGLCLGFLLWRQRSLPVMLAGGLLSGVAGIAVVVGLRRYTRIKDDAALGIVLSLFFGAGLALVRLIQRRPGFKLLGGDALAASSPAGIDHFIFGSAAGMTAGDVKLISAVAGGCLLAVLLLYKEFRLVTFDAGFARVQGWPASLIDFVIMLMVSITVIAALPAAGVVLTAALLILPAAAARFWTDWLGAMLFLSALFGGLIGAAGTMVSAQAGGMPTGPTIVLAGATVFLMSMLFARRRGMVARMLADRRLRARVVEQKALLALYAMAESRLPELASIDLSALGAQLALPSGRLRAVLRHAESEGWVASRANNDLRLTALGIDRAAAVTRAHRLWRLFLTEYPDSASLFNDLDVEAIDEALPAEMVAELEEKLGNNASGGFR